MAIACACTTNGLAQTVQSTTPRSVRSTAIVPHSTLTAADSALLRQRQLQMQQRIQQMQQKRRPGLTYTDLTMNDPDGKTMKLSQFVGKSKLVLVDFWASWCGPCRAEMPYVVSAYEKYKGSGLQIVGVSFDKNAEAWTAAIKQLGMAWPQMSDLKGWECAAHEVYGVSSIPSNILVDAKGTIVATDLRGEQLLQTIANLLGNE